MRQSILLGLVLLLPGVASGQTDRPPAAASTPPLADKAPANARPMYEDIEVMRRLIGRAVVSRAGLGQCTSCHVATAATHAKFQNAVGGPNGPGAVMGDFDNDGRADLFVPDGHHPHHVAVAAAVEGSYLKGHGVVYHLTLPEVARAELAPSGPAPAAKPASDWEQVRRQLRGETEAPPAPAKKVTLTDALLQVLAENGKNFTHLPPNESLTLVVTFRGDAGGPKLLRNLPPGGVGMMGVMGGGPGGMPDPMGGSGSAGPMAPMGGMKPPEPSGGGGQPLTPDRELELLGDLHLKRGNLNDAASAFERAIAKAREVQIAPNTPHEKAKQAAERANERLVALTRKLADVHLRANNLDAARKALEGVSVKLSVADVKPGARAPESTAVKLPGKLIISVPKRQLDRVAGGPDKISFEEFLQLATIEVPVFDAR